MYLVKRGGKGYCIYEDYMLIYVMLLQVLYLTVGVIHAVASVIDAARCMWERESLWRRSQGDYGMEELSIASSNDDSV